MMAVTKLERVHVRLKLTAVQLSEDEDARLIAHVAFKHGQELGSVLDSLSPVAHHAGTNVLVMRVAPVMMLHSMAW